MRRVQEQLDFDIEKPSDEQLHERFNKEGKRKKVSIYDRIVNKKKLKKLKAMSDD